MNNQEEKPAVKDEDKSLGRLFCDAIKATAMYLFSKAMKHLLILTALFASWHREYEFAAICVVLAFYEQNRRRENLLEELVSASARPEIESVNLTINTTEAELMALRGEQSNQEGERK